MYARHFLPSPFSFPQLFILRLMSRPGSDPALHNSGTGIWRRMSEVSPGEILSTGFKLPEPLFPRTQPLPEQVRDGKCGGSEVRIIIAASSSSGLLNQKPH
jgi:hypothetical protein